MIANYNVYIKTKQDYEMFLKKLNIPFGFYKEICFPDIELKPTTKIPKKEKFRLYRTCNINKMFFPYITRNTINYYMHLILKVDINKCSISKLEKILETKISPKKAYFWYPEEIRRPTGKGLYTGKFNRYPIFIPSKGRYDRCYTAYTLMKMGIFDFKIVVEEQEYDLYRKYFYPDNLIILPNRYIKEYEVLDNINLKEIKGVGPGAVRNFIFDYSKECGYDYCWAIDDNVTYFNIFNRNESYYCLDGTPFRMVEILCECYPNIAMAGINYAFFVFRKKASIPLFINNRIFSIILMNTKAPVKWMGRFNDDVITSYNILKKGWATVTVNFALAKKKETQQVKGGCATTIYNLGTLLKSYTLKKVFPEETELVFRFNRWHHHIDFSKVKNNSLGKFKQPKETIKKFKIINLPLRNSEQANLKKASILNVLPHLDAKERKELILSRLNSRNLKYLKRYIDYRPPKANSIARSIPEIEKFSKYKSFTPIKNPTKFLLVLQDIKTIPKYFNSFDCFLCFPKTQDVVKLAEYCAETFKNLIDLVESPKNTRDKIIKHIINSIDKNLFILKANKLIKVK